MKIRIRRRMKLFPGCWMNYFQSLNPRKDGTYPPGTASMSFGRRGCTINIGKRGPRLTVGAPGTGVCAQFTPQDVKSIKSSPKAPRNGNFGAWHPVSYTSQDKELWSATQMQGSPGGSKNGAWKRFVVLGAMGIMAFGVLSQCEKAQAGTRTEESSHPNDADIHAVALFVENLVETSIRTGGAYDYAHMELACRMEGYRRYPKNPRMAQWFGAAAWQGTMDLFTMKGWNR